LTAKLLFVTLCLDEIRTVAGSREYGHCGRDHAVQQMSNKRNKTKRRILGQLGIGPEAEQCKVREPEQSGNAEEMSEAELDRLQKLIEDRRQIARDTDISYHLWGLYESKFRNTGQQSADQGTPDGEWYDIRILRASSRNGLNEFEFELKGDRFRFVDDEEKQGWRENIKYFSLFLYDDSDRCLIEIPMKLRVDRWGRNYAILTDGPAAFLPGGWASDFINVRLKHQSIHNQEIRSQKHRERLREIEDLKKRFGILD